MLKGNSRSYKFRFIAESYMNQMCMIPRVDYTYVRREQPLRIDNRI